ncbi:hypothetical protein ACFPRL_13715 [Pseudoclavibacter helvolus]
MCLRRGLRARRAQQSRRLPRLSEDGGAAPRRDARRFLNRGSHLSRSPRTGGDFSCRKQKWTSRPKYEKVMPDLASSAAQCGHRSPGRERQRG